MALMRCPDCHKKISTNADACPKCGYKLSSEDREKAIIPNKRTCLLITFSVCFCVLLLAFGVLLWKMQAEEKPYIVTKQILSVFPEGLRSAYSDHYVFSTKYLNDHIEDYTEYKYYSCILYGEVDDIEISTYGDDIYAYIEKNSNLANILYGKTRYSYRLKNLDPEITFNFLAPLPKEQPDIKKGNSYYFAISILYNDDNCIILINAVGES